MRLKISPVRPSSCWGTQSWGIGSQFKSRFWASLPPVTSVPLYSAASSSIKKHREPLEWLSKGHGEYREIPSERDFFQEVKESKKVVCHFYRDSTFRCKILDRHLVILSKKHLETKFLKLNVEKAPFLCERLRIKVIPTLALVKDGKTQDFVVGFSDLGNTDDFTTETLEWRLGCADILNYSGNLMEPPFQSQKKFGTNFTKLEKKTIRGKKYDSDSDDD
nr:thioredoxin domain-containing protein 9 isoform X2 [Odocoileus virginianus texanus]